MRAWLAGLTRSHPGLLFFAAPCLIALIAVGLTPVASARHPAAATGAAGPTGSVLAESAALPDFALPSLQQSGTAGSADLRGHVSVVVFWASWCPGCRRELPAVRRVWQAYHNRGVRFLGVDYQDERAPAQKFAVHEGLPFRSVVDARGGLLASFGTADLPATYMVDASGTVRFLALGVTDPDHLEHLLSRLLAAPPRRALARRGRPSARTSAAGRRADARSW